MADASATRRESSVQVAVRVRPLLPYETSDPKARFVLTHPSAKQVCMNLANGKKKTFTYDRVFAHDRSQTEVFEAVRHMLSDLLDGYNVTLIAYGQTGSGKTFTMGSEAGDAQLLSHAQGLIPRYLQELFGSMGPNYKVAVSFLEVYGNDVYDLLDADVANHALKRRSLAVYEDEGGAVQVKGLSTHSIASASDAIQWLRRGTENRSTASTMMNQVSSRSHAIFTLSVTAFEGDPTEGARATTTAKLTFVDLAGSERLGRTQATGQRAREGIDINMGLLCLGNVINALADDARIQSGDAPAFVPYRSHKLTRLLRDSLGGNSKTFFLACVSPASLNTSETLSTLTYANRARNIKNKPVKNLDPMRVELLKNKFAVAQLQRELVKARFGFAGDEDDAAKPADPEVHSFLNETMTRIFEAFDSHPGVHARIVQGSVGTLDSTATSSAAAATSASMGAPGSTPGVGGAHASETRRLGANEGPAITVLSLHAGDATVDAAAGGNAGGDVEAEDDDDDASTAGEMEALGRLWALHEREKKFFDEKADHAESMDLLDGQITEKEGLLQQLRDGLERHQAVKAKMQELCVQVAALEAEKGGLLRQMEDLAAGGKKPGETAEHRERVVGGLRAKLKAVEDRLGQTKADAAGIRAASRAAEREAKRARELEGALTTLKASKGALMRKQKEAATAHAAYVKECNRRNAALRKTNLRDKRAVGKLTAQSRRQQSTISRFRGRETRLQDQLRRAQEHISRLVKVQGRQRRQATGRNLASKQRSRSSRRNAGDLADAEAEPARPGAPSIPDAVPEDDASVACLEEVMNQLVRLKVDLEELTRERDETVVEYGALSAELMREVNYLKDLRKDPVGAATPEHATMDGDEGLEMEITAAEERVDACGLRLDVLAGRLEELDECLEKLRPADATTAGGLSHVEATEARVREMLQRVDPQVCRRLLMRTVEATATLAVERSLGLHRVQSLTRTVDEKRLELRELKKQLKKSKVNFERRLTAADNEVDRMVLASPLSSKAQHSSFRRQLKAAETTARDQAAEMSRLQREKADADTEVLAQRHRNVRLEEELCATQAVLTEEALGEPDGTSGGVRDAVQALQEAWTRLGVDIDQREDRLREARSATQQVLDEALQEAAMLQASSEDALSRCQPEAAALETFLGGVDASGELLDAEEDGSSGSVELPPPPRPGQTLLDQAHAVRTRHQALQDAAQARLGRARALREEALRLLDALGSPAVTAPLVALCSWNAMAPVSGDGNEPIAAAIAGKLVLPATELSTWESAVRSLRLEKRTVQARLTAQAGRIVGLMDALALCPEAVLQHLEAEAAGLDETVRVVVLDVLCDAREPRGRGRVDAARVAASDAASTTLERLAEARKKVSILAAAAVAGLRELLCDGDETVAAMREDLAGLGVEMTALPVADAEEANGESPPDDGADDFNRDLEDPSATAARIWHLTTLGEAMAEAVAAHQTALAPYAPRIPASSSPRGSDHSARNTARAVADALAALTKALESLPEASRKCFGAGTSLESRAVLTARNLESNVAAARNLRVVVQSFAQVRRADEALCVVTSELDTFKRSTRSHRRSKIQSKKMNSTYLLHEDRTRREHQAQIKSKLRRLREALRAGELDICDAPLSETARRLLSAAHLESSTQSNVPLTFSSPETEEPKGILLAPTPVAMRQPVPIAPMRSMEQTSGSGGANADLGKTRTARKGMAGGAFAMLLQQNQDKENELE